MKQPVKSFKSVRNDETLTNIMRIHRTWTREIAIMFKEREAFTDSSKDSYQFIKYESPL